MPRFFVTSSDISSSEDGLKITVRGDDAAHITRVLRMRLGERVEVCDDNSVEYETVVSSLGVEVTLDVISVKQSQNEPPYKATVYQALVKGDRFDTVIQKSTELGVCSIVPVITDRCMVKLTESDYSKKTERWQRIAYEAAKQCGRGVIPKVERPIMFRDAIKAASEADVPLFCFEGKGTLPITEQMPMQDKINSVSVFIGPEGGFSDDEATFAHESGMKMTGLGKRILRTETAAPFVLSCLSFKYEL
ncbi:MAG: 16S rRNA (uracil(1498)-N(3))-methyltransferase [Ruminococcaceae bacterium]|nr:16S rRNA (uracil(1498)-N(3))-methyltransferase [Oscillospiraceae bacterium]